MKYRIRKFRSGVTLVELTMVSVISVIVILAVTTLMADSQKGFNSVYNKTNSNLANDDFVVRKIFSSVIRPCSNDSNATSVAVDGSWVQMQYYSGTSTDSLDRYAKFYLQDGELLLEKGVITPASTLSLQTVCQSVSSVVFKKNGNSVFMFLELNDGTNSREINTSAILHNP
jgi:hypothetical protein